MNNVEGDVVEGAVNCVGINMVVQMLNEIKTGKSLVPSDVSLQLIAASRELGIQVMLCQTSRYTGNIN